jgi:hypothetical protein
MGIWRGLRCSAGTSDVRAALRRRKLASITAFKTLAALYWASSLNSSALQKLTIREPLSEHCIKRRPEEESKEMHKCDL